MRFWAGTAPGPWWACVALIIRRFWPCVHGPKSLYCTKSHLSCVVYTLSFLCRGEKKNENIWNLKARFEVITEVCGRWKVCCCGWNEFLGLVSLNQPLLDLILNLFVAPLKFTLQPLFALPLFHNFLLVFCLCVIVNLLFVVTSSGLYLISLYLCLCV